MKELKDFVEMLVLILFGPPGAGKETVVNALIERGFRIVQIVMSSLLKEAAEREDLSFAVKKTIKDYIAAGKLVPNDIVIPLFLEAMEKRRSAGEFVILVLDGVFRTEEQAMAYVPALLQLKRCQIVAMDLMVTEENCVQRMLGRKRPGETEPVIRQRLAIDKENRDKCKRVVMDAGIEILRIDGNPPLPEVVKQAEDKLGKLVPVTH